MKADLTTPLPLSHAFFGFSLNSGVVEERDTGGYRAKDRELRFPAFAETTEIGVNLDGDGPLDSQPLPTIPTQGYAGSA